MASEKERESALTGDWVSLEKGTPAGKRTWHCDPEGEVQPPLCKHCKTVLLSLLICLQHCPFRGPQQESLEPRVKLCLDNEGFPAHTNFHRGPKLALGHGVIFLGILWTGHTVKRDCLLMIEGSKKTRGG